MTLAARKKAKRTQMIIRKATGSDADDLKTL